MNKDKPFEKFKNDLKHFFRGSKPQPGTYNPKEECIVTYDVECEISAKSPVERRVKAIRELSEAILTSKLEEHAIEKICHITNDILNENSSKEFRHAVIHLYQCLVVSQPEKIGPMRTYFFKVLQCQYNNSDNEPRLELFKKLTENGKKIAGFEDEIGYFLLDWMPAIVAAGNARSFLEILVNYVKHNAAYIDDEINTGIIGTTSILCCQSDSDEVVLASLQVLDTIVCYGNISQASMGAFITAISRAISVEPYYDASWKIMRNLLGTHMGYFCLQTMCIMIQDEKNYDDVGLIRGIIFNLNMALLIRKPDLIMSYMRNSILPSIWKAVRCSNPIILVEVSLCTKCLVEKYGRELNEIYWDRVIAILRVLSTKTENTFEAVQYQTYVNDAFNKIEELLDFGYFRGNIHNLYIFLKDRAVFIPEGLVIRLIDYLADFISPLTVDWILKLKRLMNDFYVKDVRPNVRIKALSTLYNIVQHNRIMYEHDLINKIVEPLFKDIAFEENNSVRGTAVKYLVEMCQNCDENYVLPFFNMFGKILQQPFEKKNAVYKNENECSDVNIVLDGLLHMFAVSIYHLPAANSVCALDIMTTFLERHYKHPTIFENVVTIRLKIINCLLRLRTNANYHLGYSEDGSQIHYSSFLIVNHKRPPNALSANADRDSKSATIEGDLFVASDVTCISLSKACQVIVMALERETDWRVLQPILKDIPTALKHRALIQSRNLPHVELLVNSLICMVTVGNYPENLKSAPTKFSKTEFYGYVVPALSVFASYHTHLDFSQQKRLIQCVEIGLDIKSASQCVSVLMTCLLEMRDAMVKLLPDVLLKLSKISATVRVAIPILEFLSMLTTFPKVFVNFTQTQFMSIFAIIFPYTNSFKYHHYTVSLAHHVIAVWFLKCRKPFRREFVKFIINGLKTNVFGPFADSILRNELINQDSSNRKRSSSLTEQGSRTRMAGSNRCSRAGGQTDPKKESEMLLFHRELTDTCIDLMARVTFSNNSALPKRHPSSEFILQNGHSMTWILGAKLITVTTSGCTEKAIRSGLCDTCSQTCSKKLLESKQENASQDIETDTDTDNCSTKNIQKISDDNQQSTKESIDEGRKTVTDTLENKKKDDEEDENQHLCTCWCQGWAEIHIRRPTGDMSWIMRFQNEMNTTLRTDPLIDMSFLNHATTIEEGEKVANETEVHSPELEQPDVSGTSTPATESKEDLLSCTIEQFPLSSPTIKIIQEPGSETKSTYSNEAECTTSSDLPTHLETDNNEEVKTKTRTQIRSRVRRSISSPEMTSTGKFKFPARPSYCVDTLSGNRFEDEFFYDSYRPLICKTSGERPILEAFESHKQTLLASQMNTLAETQQMTFHADSVPAQASAETDSTSVSNAESTPVVLPFFDQSSWPNEDFKFERSASVSQVVPPGKKEMASRYLTQNLASSQPHLTTKPPLSPPALSPKNVSPNKDPQIDSNFDLFNPSMQDYKRYRTHTISVMKSHNTVESVPENVTANITTPNRNESRKSGLNPSFVFLQLYDSSQFGNSPEKPLLMPSNSSAQRGMHIFDLIPPYETHKVGVLYVGPGQANNEVEILKNTFGSIRYAEFLAKLGTLVTLADVNPKNIFLGGLEKNGNDGKFAYIWIDEVMQVIFHVATLMPNKDTDVNCNSKKKHIGNDYVTIVYNESGEEYNLNTVKCQFNYASVIVEPLDHGSHQLTVKARDDLLELVGHGEPKIVSDKNVSLLARQLALHINLASVILSSLKAQPQGGAIYASNWLERLRKIKHIRNNVLDSMNVSSGTSELQSNRQHARRIQMSDFTEYT